ncbi:GDP-mannose 4,6-dehydratase, partial [Frankia sp. Ag45/Mut15]|nr:GDP-mannose 4,6-dehydratase [Frankia umida]
DASKAREVLGWQPRVAFEELVAMMVEGDLALESDAAAREGLRPPPLVTPRPDSDAPVSATGPAPATVDEVSS